MKCNCEKQEKNQVKLTVTLNAEEWEQAIDAAYRKTKHQYKAAGFRPGKMPRHMIEAMYGKGVFFEDAFNGCFPEYYEKALEKNKDVFPVDRPDVDVSDIGDNGITFTATVTVKPEVTLGAYTGIKYDKPSTTVSKKELDEAIEAEREKLSRLVDVADRAAENGDTVIIDYSGFKGEEQFAGGTAEGQNLELGSNTFIPGFEAQVVGMKIGEEKDINVTFPEDYHAEELKGAAVVFKVKLHEIKKKELPALDDDFAKDVSEFETFKDYKADLKKKLETKKAERAVYETENIIVEKVTANATVDIPACMIDQEVEDMIMEMSYRMQYQGLKLEDYLKYTGSTMEKLREDYKKQAKKNVKTRLVIDAIIKKEGFTSDKESYDAKIKELAAKAKKSAKEYRESLGEQNAAQLKNTIIMDKLFTFLKENNVGE